jgi:3' exoribonuclease, RNase T-like
MTTSYWLDTKFIDTGSIIDLISIGLVSDDGRELYLQSTWFNPTKASQWVKENVLVHLAVCPHYETRGQLSKHDSSLRDIPEIHPQIISLARHEVHGQCTFERSAKGITGLRGAKMSGFIVGAYTDCPWRTREQMRNEIRVFLDPEKYGKPELYGWCSGYDWVALCQLFGMMIDLPTGWPHYIKDFQQILDDRGISDDDLPEQEDGLHNALADARHLKKLWGYIVRNDCWQ